MDWEADDITEALKKNSDKNASGHLKASFWEQRRKG